jgi:Zn-dependent protease
MFGFSIPTILVRLVVLFLAIPIHEWAHAWSAYQLGDDTASLQGRLTLNPMAHLDPIGSLLILVSGFGWGKPVPVNPYRLRTGPRVGHAITAFAGPLSNFVLAMLLAIPFRMHWTNYAGASMDLYTQRLSIGALLLIAIEINLGLMLFNLIPLFPLDGEKVLVGVLPPRWGDSLLRIRPYGSIILAGLMFVLPRVGIDPIGKVIAPAYWFLRDLLVFL